MEKLEHAQTEYAGLERDLRLVEGLVEPGWVDSWTEASGPTPDLARVERLNATAEALAGKRPACLWLRMKRAFASATLRRRLVDEFECLTATLPEDVRTHLRIQAGTAGAGQFSQLSEACGRLERLVLWRCADDKCCRALSTIGTEVQAHVLAQELDHLQCRRAELASDQLRAGWTRRLASRAGLLRQTLDQYFDLSSRLKKSSGKAAFLDLLGQLKTTVHRVSADFPVWVVTNLAVRNALPLEPAIFDLVIFDEASQCDIPSALPLLFRARRALVIGDPYQLSHISTLTQGEEEKLADEYGVTNLLASWSYNKRSFYALAGQAVVEQGGEPLFLAEHYRSHPEIIEFSNRQFYQGRLILRTALGNLSERLKGERLGMFWHDVHGAVARSSHSAVNEIEVRAVIDLLDEWAHTGLLFRSDVSFGVVTPFKLQMERIERAVGARPWRKQVDKDKLTVGTAHVFQGNERDVMIFSPVVAEGMHKRLVHWVASTDHLLNVAVTRARGALHIVGDLQMCLSSGHSLARFAAAARDGCGSLNPTLNQQNPAEERMAELLTEIGLWHAPQHNLTAGVRLDFLVVSPFGTRYDIEVDGRGHRESAAFRNDERRDAKVKAMGLKVLRVEARRIFYQETAIRELLRRLV